MKLIGIDKMELTPCLIRNFVLSPFQSGSLKVCDIDPELKKKLDKFRFRKGTNSAGLLSMIIIIRCNKKVIKYIQIYMLCLYTSMFNNFSNFANWK